LLSANGKVRVLLLSSFEVEADGRVLNSVMLERGKEGKAEERERELIIYLMV